MSFIQLSEVVQRMQAWNNAETIAEYPPAIAKRDNNGFSMLWDHYGRADSAYGWQCHSVTQSDDQQIDDFLGVRARHCGLESALGQLNDNNFSTPVRRVG